MMKKSGNGIQPKELIMTDLNKLTDYEAGEWDCVHARPAAECMSAQYYSGYGDAYASEQSANWYSEKKFLEIMGEANEV